MSVPKSKRGEAKVKFIQDVAKARIKTLEMLNKFPKGFKFGLPNSIAEIATQAYWYAVGGNAVFFHKNITAEDFSLRRKYFQQAYMKMRALTAEVSFCYTLIMQGNNFFPDKAKRDKQFADWVMLCATASTSLKNILKSDMERFKKYQEPDKKGNKKKLIL